MDPLTTSLLDLVQELGDEGPQITVGGGFGLFLKRKHLLSEGKEMLFRQLPESRSTNDLDLFVRTEILADYQRTLAIAEAIKRLGYLVVDEAKFLQWRKSILIVGVEQEVKIDFLVGPLGDYRKQLNVNPPRVRPKKKVELHAHQVEEALGIEDSPIAVTVKGKNSKGIDCQARVYVPQAFSYLMMKLHAFEDRKQDENKDLGRHHALDLYSIVGMMVEEEYHQALQLGQQFADNEYVRKAKTIVQDNFSGDTMPGMLRLREHLLFRPEFLLNDFMKILNEIFPT